MGNPVVVAAQMAAHGDEVARLRADLHAARADAAEQARLRVEAETTVVEARGERDRLAARVRELEYTLAACKDLGIAADSAAVALLRRAVDLARIVRGLEHSNCEGCEYEDAKARTFLADARAFLEVSLG